MNFKSLFGEYLEHSIRYYAMDSPVISDQEYDKICQTLLINWDKFEHRYKHLCSEDLLRAGTGYQLTFEAPHEIVRLCRLNPEKPLKEVFK